jgi:hypothetical protein
MAKESSAPGFALAAERRENGARRKPLAGVRDSSKPRRMKKSGRYIFESEK